MEQAKVFNSGDFARHLRPAFTPVTVTIMIVFFAIGAWPLGLLMIGYMLYGKELGIDFSNWGKARESVQNINRSFGFGGGTGAANATGNDAFDEWRSEELRKIDEERRRLDETRRDFDEYVRELKRARDREEFQAFQERRAARKSDGDSPTV